MIYAGEAVLVYYFSNKCTCLNQDILLFTGRVILLVV